MLIEENKLIIIAFIPRSGSNYFCDMLLRVGGLGAPLEYYFPYDFKSRVADWNGRTSPLEYIDQKLVPNETKWFLEVLRREAIKCTWDAHKVMLEEAKSMMDRLSLSYVYLRRRDKLRQAISWYRADENKRWTSKDPEQPDPPYSQEGIQLRLDWITWQEQQWDEYLKDIDCLELFYEDLNYETIRQYEEFTGMRRHRDRDIDSEYTILRDKKTEEWVERFKQ
jgi:LPS sulfotransferase NodH